MVYFFLFFLLLVWGDLPPSSAWRVQYWSSRRITCLFGPFLPACKNRFPVPTGPKVPHLPNIYQCRGHVALLTHLRRRKKKDTRTHTHTHHLYSFWKYQSLLSSHKQLTPRRENRRALSPPSRFSEPSMLSLWQRWLSRRELCPDPAPVPSVPPFPPSHPPGGLDWCHFWRSTYTLNLITCMYFLQGPRRRGTSPPSRLRRRGHVVGHGALTTTRKVTRCTLRSAFSSRLLAGFVDALPDWSLYEDF